MKVASAEVIDVPASLFIAPFAYHIKDSQSEIGNVSPMICSHFPTHPTSPFYCKIPLKELD